ncbi:MAG: hypothetical protein KBS45_01845 [Clostridiales bacterium]|nr:hypothetical protein [Candidatus Coliplasma caballi]
MKKILSITLVCVMLLALGALAVSAEEPVYVFEIRTVNEHIKGEDAVLCTTQDAYDNCGPGWAITVLCDVVSENVLKVKDKPIVGKGELPQAAVGNGVVALVVHSATSDTAKSDQYPGVFAKVAAMQIEKGQFLVLEGIDLAAGTGAGKATLVNELPGDISVDEPVESSEEPAASSEEPTESSEEPATESSEEPAATSSEAPAAESEAESVAPAESEEENKEEGGLSAGTIALIVAAAVVVIAAVVFFVLKGKKK